MIAAGSRLRLFYFLIFAGLGIFLPFYSVYLEGLGLSGWEISLLSISIPLVKVIMPPLYGMVADFWTGRKILLRLFTVGSFVVWPLLFVAKEFWGLLAVFSLYALFRAPVIAFANAAALTYLHQSRDSFGRIRLYGSIGFILAVMISGFWADEFGIAAILQPFGLFLFLTAVVSFTIDTGDEGLGFKASREDLRILLHDRLFLFLLAVIFLIRSAEGGYNIFYSLHVVKTGYLASTAGMLWGLGVVSEVIILFFAGPVIKHWSLWRWIVAMGILNTLRWLLLSWSAAMPVLIMGQLLHGFTFGLFYLLAIEALERHTAPQLKNTVQSIFDTVGFGLAGIAGTLVAGWFWESGASAMFGVAAVIAAAGTLLTIAAPASIRKELSSL